MVRIRDYAAVIAIAFCAFGNGSIIKKVVVSKTDVELVCNKTTSISSKHLNWTFDAAEGNSDFKRTVIHRDVNTLPSTSAINNTSLLITDDVTKSTLTIASVTMGNAGTYLCSEVSVGTDSIRFDLVVFEKEPICSSNIPTDGQLVEENSTVQLNCSATYSGSLLAEFQCLPKVEHEVERNVTEGDSFRKTIHYQKWVTADPMFSEKNQMCLLHLISAGVNVTINSQLSSTTYMGTANVTYGPRDITIEKVDKTLKCRAVGYPKPTYHWFDLELNAMVGNGDSLDICRLDSLNQKRGLMPYLSATELISLRCIASITNRSNATQDYLVNVTSPAMIRKLCDGENDDEIFVLFAVATFMLVAPVVCVLLAALVRRKSIEDRRRESNDCSAAAGGGGVNVTAEQQRANTENNTAEHVVSNRCPSYEEIAGNFAAQSIEPYYISRPIGLMNVAAGSGAFVEAASTGTGSSSPEPPPARQGHVLPHLELLKIDNFPTPYVDATTSGYCGLSPVKRHAPVPTSTAYCHLSDSSTGTSLTEHVQNPLIVTTSVADENVPNSARDDYIRLLHPCTSSPNGNLPAAVETGMTNFLRVKRTGRISGSLGVSQADDGDGERPPTPPPPYASYLELSDDELSGHE